MNPGRAYSRAHTKKGTFFPGYSKAIKSKAHYYSFRTYFLVGDKKIFESFL
jgi:hypothetical protein